LFLGEKLQESLYLGIKLESEKKVLYIESIESGQIEEDVFAAAFSPLDCNICCI